MKICQVLFSVGEGGLEKHVRDLSISLAHAGHEVSVIADPRFLTQLPKEVKGYPLSSDYSRWHPILYFKLFRLIAQIQPDIVHAQANKAAHVIACLRPVIKPITVGTLHNMKRNTKAFTKLDHVITVSQTLAKPFKQSHCTTIYNGITPPKAISSINLSDTFDLPADRPTFVAVGRLVETKGFDVLLEAIDGLEVNLLIIGDGPEQEALKKQSDQLSPMTHVQLLGYREDVQPLIASASGLLISSRREGFSYVLSEALLLEIPVLSTDVPVANEVLPNCLIAPTNEAAPFRAKLIALMNDISTWEAHMIAAFEQAQSSMTLQGMAQSTLDCYETLLEAQGC